MFCESPTNTCNTPANELFVNTNNLSEYKFLCPEHRNAQLAKAGWYRASEDVKQTVLMNRAKDKVDRWSGEIVVKFKAGFVNTYYPKTVESARRMRDYYRKDRDVVSVEVDGPRL